jgi:hypothetical protein
MPTYLYETLPDAGGGVSERFEVKQHFSEPPLAAHPVTGKPVRRVISGGMGLVTRSAADADLPEPGPGCGPETCRCGRFD